MKQSLTILICILALNTFGQTTKEITKKYKNPWYTEKYNVLKSDKKVKHGNFQKLGYQDCLVINGYYKVSFRFANLTLLLLVLLILAFFIFRK